jgi:hypothetical protein
MRTVAAIVAIALLAWMLPPPAAGAEGLTPAQRKQADRHFAEGKRLFGQEAWDEALVAFEAANAIAPHPVVLANIGLCHERAGRVAEALAVYRAFIADPKVSEEQADEIWARIDALEARMGRIEVTCPVPDCEAVVDGVPRGPAPVVVLVEPGSRRVEGAHPRESFEPAVVQVGAGGSKVVELVWIRPEPEPEPEPEPDPEPEPEPESEGISLGVPFWIATGVTAAGGIGIIAFGARTLKLKDDYEASDRLDSGLRSDGERSRLATNVMVGITGAAAAAAAGLLIHALVKGQSENETAARTRLAPLLGDVAGISLAREF